MNIYLVRHAKAEKHAARGGDAARALTPEGRARFEALLAALGDRLAVTRVVTSPFRRARETAELLARARGAPLEEEEALASGASDARAILELARRHGAGVALVGHNPELGEAVAMAAGGSVEVKPGTIAKVELGGRGAKMVWIEATPK